MKQLGNVKAIFKIDRNLDYHLRLDDEAALEAKVIHLKFCSYTTIKINNSNFQQRFLLLHIEPAKDWSMDHSNSIGHSHGVRKARV